MNKVYLVVFFVLQLLGIQKINAQLANQEKLTASQVKDRINGLLSKGIEQGKDSIRWEATHLLNSKKLDYILHARSIFEFLGDDETSNKAQERAIKIFPKSSYAANEGLSTLLNEYLTYEAFNKGFEKWTKRHRDLLKDKKFANTTYAKVAEKLLASGEVDRSNVYIQQVDDTDLLLEYQYSLAYHYFDNQNLDKAEQLLINITKQYASKISEISEIEEQVYGFYAQILVGQQKWQEALDMIESKKLNMKEEEFKALIGVKRYFDAFLSLDRQFAQESLSEELEKLGPELFQHLGSDVRGWTDYKERIEQKKQHYNQCDWNAELVDLEAVPFELTDMDGNLVKSSDFFGKVIVLDFWATWCGPCINSFPGMQATVNKFKSDKDVVFLFINTWEKEKDYKDRVAKFMQEKGYDFKVLFDQMASKEALVQKYGIEGIPTKILIDKKGRVRFKSSGSSSSVKEIVDEISYKIELLKK